LLQHHKYDCKRKIVVTFSTNRFSIFTRKQLPEMTLENILIIFFQFLLNIDLLLNRNSNLFLVVLVFSF
jgi:hypothetical protein